MPHGHGSLWIAGAVGLLLVLGILFWWWRKPSRRGPGNVAPRARSEALEALSRCPTDNCTETATHTSLILRRYLAEVTADPALYETHEELMARSNALESLSEGLREEAGRFFLQLARLKYARSEGGENPAALPQQARDLLEALHREVAA